MSYKLITPPAVEPLTLSETRDYLRADTTDFTTATTSSQSIAPGSHVIAAVLNGAAIDVLGKKTLAILEAGTNGAGGTVDVKIQHRNALTEAWADVADGAFDQVTEATDNATYEIEYTGGKKYVRVVAAVAGAACEFGVSVLTQDYASQEGTLITSLIVAAREYCEARQGRKYITQSWERWLDYWPLRYYFPAGSGHHSGVQRTEDAIDLLPSLQSVESVKYYGEDGAEYTMVTDYEVDTVGDPGRVVLAPSCSWPSVTLRSTNGICVSFTCGYGDVASDVPETVKLAMKLLIGHWFLNREAIGAVSQELEFAVTALLGVEKVLVI